MWRRSPGRAGIDGASLKVTPNNRGISLKAAVAQTNASWLCVGESESLIFGVLPVRSHEDKHQPGVRARSGDGERGERGNKPLMR